MVETLGTAKSVEVLSLQARLDQIEAGLDSAHNHVDKVQPRLEGQSDAPPAAASAQDAASRCQRKLEELNHRLMNVAELVGVL